MGVSSTKREQSQGMTTDHRKPGGEVLPALFLEERKSQAKTPGADVCSQPKDLSAGASSAWFLPEPQKGWWKSRYHPSQGTSGPIEHTGPQCSKSSSSGTTGGSFYALDIRQNQGITLNFVVCGTGIRESLFFFKWNRHFKKCIYF